MNWERVVGNAALIPLLSSAVAMSVPVAVAAAGECVAESAGVLNLGVEGMMLAGGLVAFLATYATHDPAVGALAGVLTGTALAAAMAALVVGLALDQVVVGVTLVVLAGGVASFTYLERFGVTTSPPQLALLGAARVPLVGRIPGVGAVVFHHNGLVLAGLAVPFLLAFLLHRTSLGLALRAAGDAPAEADAAGVAVNRVRAGALVIGGACAGLAGAILVVGDVGLFRDGITGGRGWIAIAMVIVGRWDPVGALAASLLFGLTDALQLRIQTAAGGFTAGFPYELFQALPYAVPLLVLVATARWGRRRQPLALGTPFVRARR